MPKTIRIRNTDSEMDSVRVFLEENLKLDSESEREVQAAIESIMGKCTIIMVAHRLNTIRKADVIYRFEDGLVTRCDSLDAETSRSDSSVTDSMISFTTEQ